MNRYFWLFALFIWICGVLSACARPTPIVSTVVASPAPTIQPTASIAPTLRPITHTSQSVLSQQQLTNALRKTSDLKEYAFEFANFYTTTLQSGSITAQYHSILSIKITETAFYFHNERIRLPQDPDNPDIDLEKILTSDGLYARGTLKIAGTTPDQWYLFTDPPKNLQGFFNLKGATYLLVRYLQATDFTIDQKIRLDNQQCTRYSGNNTAVFRMIDSISGSLNVDIDSKRVYNPNQIYAWLVICDDGIIHQIGEYSGNPEKDDPQKNTITSNALNIVTLPDQRAITPPHDPKTIKEPFIPTTWVRKSAAIMDSPSSQGYIMARVRPGDIVALLGRTQNANWYRIQYTQGGIGWISSDALIQDSSLPDQAPVVKP